MAAAVMALKRGAADFVAKPIEPEVLQSSVRNLVHWHCSLCRELDMRRKARERFNTLTPKEQEICRRIAAGALNKQTAIDLNISEQTVKRIAQIFRKTRSTLSNRNRRISENAR